MIYKDRPIIPRINEIVQASRALNQERLIDKVSPVTKAKLIDKREESPLLDVMAHDIGRVASSLIPSFYGM